MLGSEGVMFCSSMTTAQHKFQEDAHVTRAMAMTQLITVPMFVVWRHYAVLFKRKGDSSAEVYQSDDDKKSGSLVVQQEQLRSKVHERSEPSDFTT